MTYIRGFTVEQFIEYSNAVTQLEHESDFEFTKDIHPIPRPDVYCEYFGKYWVCYNGATVPVLTHWPLGYLNENLDE